MTATARYPSQTVLVVEDNADLGDPATHDRATKAGANRFVPKSVSFVRGGLSGLVSSISQAIRASAEKDKALVKKP